MCRAIVYQDILTTPRTVLFHVDLDEPMNQTNIISIPDYVDGLKVDPLSNPSFMVVGKHRVYVVISTYVLIYGYKDGSRHWYKSGDSLMGISGAIYTAFSSVLGTLFTSTIIGGALTNDEQYIYVFTAPNGKAYIDGCYIASWKTAIFDMDTEEFKMQGLDIDNPISTVYHRNNHLTVFDDNILLLYSMPLYSSIGEHFSLYYTITNDISINISNTITKIWPSDGILFQYYINDLSENKKEQYKLDFRCNATQQIINETITFDTAKDHCICDGYNCRECSEYFNLSQYLTIEDNDIDRLICTLSPNDTNTDILILPDTTPIIELQRCEISFTNTNPISNSDKPLIRFTSALDEICNLVS